MLQTQWRSYPRHGDLDNYSPRGSGSCSGEVVVWFVYHLNSFFWVYRNSPKIFFVQFEGGALAPLLYKKLCVFYQCCFLNNFASLTISQISAKIFHFYSIFEIYSYIYTILCMYVIYRYWLLINCKIIQINKMNSSSVIDCRQKL